VSSDSASTTQQVVGSTMNATNTLVPLEQAVVQPSSDIVVEPNSSISAEIELVPTTSLVPKTGTAQVGQDFVNATNSEGGRMASSTSSAAATTGEDVTNNALQLLINAIGRSASSSVSHQSIRQVRPKGLRYTGA